MKLLHNALVRTLDPGRPTGSAIAIDHGRIIAVGGDELLGEVEPNEREDMGRRTILPGLTDAHIHLQKYALSLSMVNCEVDSKGLILERVSERACQTPPGSWVLGHGWDQNVWGGTWPSAADLDAVAPQNPVFLTAKSLHAAWANSAALRLAGILESIPSSMEGSIQLNKDGFPTGIIFEDTIGLIEAVIPGARPAALAEILQQVIPGLWHMGLTGAHDFDGCACFQALQVLHERGKLHFRVIKSIPLDQLLQATEVGLRTGFGDDMLRIGSVKLFADGALGPRTAAMFDAYVDEPKKRGILIMDHEQLFEYGCLAVESGLSLAVHAIGDRAVHEVLEGIALLRLYEREKGLPALRHRVEHVQTIHPEDSGRLANLGLIASMQPSHAPSDMLTADRALGERAALSYAWRTQIQNGACLAFGSDAPVESPNPFHGLHAAVTRCRVDGSPGPDGWYPEQRLLVGEALDAFTKGAAFAARMDHCLGKLSPGFLADLIVLDRDPVTCEPADLFSIQPVATMVGGEWVWRS